MRRLCALAAGATMCAATAPAFAQDGRWKPSAQGEQVLRDIARCVVKRRPDLSKEIVLSPADMPGAQARLLKAMDSSGCVRPVMLSFKARNDVVRWAVAEQLYLASVPQPLVAKSRAVAAGLGNGSATSYALGECVASRDPLAADAFVRTARRSSAEAEAFKRLVPVMNGCTGGTKLTLSGAEMHGVVAEALYKMRGAAAQGTY